MRARIFLLSLVFLATSCGGDESPLPYSGGAGSVVIQNPTSEDSYTTLSDTVNLYGIRSQSVIAIEWENVSTGAAGPGIVTERTGWCFFFGWYQCTDYSWGASVPLQDGQNVIKIYGNGSWADSITVTRTPSSDISGTVTYGGTAQHNIKLTLVNTADATTVKTAYTDLSGGYRFRLVTAGTYSLTPLEECYTFDPASRVVTVGDTDIWNMDFAVTVRPFAVIGGRMSYTSSGAGVSNAAFTLTNTSTAAERTVQTNPEGYFTFACVEDGQYTVAPVSAYLGGTLAATPVSQTVTISGEDVSGIDFQASFSY